MINESVRCNATQGNRFICSSRLKADLCLVASQYALLSFHRPTPYEPTAMHRGQKHLVQSVNNARTSENIRLGLRSHSLHNLRIHHSRHSRSNHQTHSRYHHELQRHGRLPLPKPQRQLRQLYMLQALPFSSHPQRTSLALGRHILHDHAFRVYTLWEGSVDPCLVHQCLDDDRRHCLLIERASRVLLMQHSHHGSLGSRNSDGSPLCIEVAGSAGHLEACTS